MRRCRWMALLLLISCATPSGTVTEELLPDLAVEQLRAAEAARVIDLHELVGHGVIELHWSDDRGAHHEQGDLDFWRRGEAISMRIGKLGEPRVWIVGEGETTTWFERGDDGWARQGREAHAPATVLRLLGLAALPEGQTTGAATDAGTILRVEDAHGWTWEALSDSRSGILQRVRAHDGEQWVVAAHRRALRVEIPGRSALSWPQVAGLVDLQVEDSDDYTKINFAWLSTDTSQEPMDRVLDSESLSRALGVTE